jgi:hypothetical protein
VEILYSFVHFFRWNSYKRLLIKPVSWTKSEIYERKKYLHSFADEDTGSFAVFDRVASVV